MYIPKRDGAFGSSYFKKHIPDHTKRYSQRYSLERTHMKLLRTKNQECDDKNSEPNTTICITRHLEKTVGCSLGMQGGDPHIERYHLKIHHISGTMTLIIKGGIFEAGFGEKVAFSWPSVDRFGKFFGGLMTLGQVKSVPNFC